MITQITTDDFSLGYSPEKIYLTSDLHLFHINIIKYCNRPFEYSAEGCTKMNEFILKKFDALPEDCLIWNFGDVFLNLRLGNDRIMQDIMRMKKNRKLSLILGNHDFRTRKKPFPNYMNTLNISVLMQYTRSHFSMEIMYFRMSLFFSKRTVTL